MNKKLFSCLIANFNNREFLDDCFQSLINQSYGYIEIVIVDDCSTDDSWEFILNYKFPSRFKIKKKLLERNYGCGTAKRICAELATGDICGFVDPDDTIELNGVERMVIAHNENPNVSLVSSKFKYVNQNLEFLKFGEIGQMIPQYHSYLTFGNNAITAFSTFKRTIYQMTEGINPNLKRAVDQDLYYRLEEVGNVLFLNEYLYNYRITEKSISANQNSFKADYWHIFVVMSDTIKRRKQNKTLKSLSHINYVKMKNSHFIWRIKLAKDQGHLFKKYFFIYKAFLTYPFQNTFYLFKCLIIPKYA